MCTFVALKRTDNNQMKQLLIATLSSLVLVGCTGNCSGDTGSGENARYRTNTPIEAVGYPAHVHLKWNDNTGSDYSVYRADKSGKFSLCSKVRGSSLMDFSIGSADHPRKFIYRICPEGMKAEQAQDFEVSVTVPQKSDDALLDMVQEYTLKYFTDFSHPVTGLARERSNDRNGDIVTTGGTGFGLMALVAGVERGFTKRSEALETIGKIVTFLENCERFHGAWAHWYDGNTGKVFSFSQYDNGGDLVETAFLAEGLLTVRQWLRNSSAIGEQALADRCDKLWREVEWDWYTRGTDSLYWHWSKDYGWKMNHRIKGFDETFITYVLAVSSPTHPIPEEIYSICYTDSPYYYNGKDYYGISLGLGMEYGGPLFFTHYSWLGLNPKMLNVDGFNMFDRNRAHTLIHYNYAIANPKKHKGYGAELWGFTSSDDPLVGYTSHHPMTDAENGTVSPTAGIGSIVYAPEESLGLIRHLYYDLGKELFGEYGFYDAYNPSMVKGQQVVRSFLAIDQGPQVGMIENYRSGLLWNLFMSCPEISAGLEKLGFCDNSQQHR